MKNERYSRRAILASLGASAAMLPLLHSEHSEGQTGLDLFPKRLVTVTWGNGVVPSDFFPQGAAGPSVPIGETLRPMEPWKDKMIITRGLDLQVMGDYEVRKYDGHFTYPTLLTGTSDPGFEVRKGLGPSIDQAYADHLVEKGINLPAQLLNLGVRSRGDGEPTSWRDSGQKNVPETDPQRVFERLFAGDSMPPEQVNLLLERRKSVLDYLRQELTAFQSRVGVVDQMKIEAHQESIRELERQLTAIGGGAGAECTDPMLGGGDDTPALMKVMFDIAAAALRCDFTRSVNIDLYDDGGGDGNSFPWLNVNRDYHGVAHDGSSAYDSKVKIDAWLYEQVANLTKQLADTPEGAVSVLDNSVILVANDMTEGAAHTIVNIPFALIGSAGGYLKTGQAVDFGGAPHNPLLATVLNAVGVPVTGFGEKYDGTFSELVA